MDRQDITDHRCDATLVELLEEPIVLALMNRDGISPEGLHALLDQVRRNLRARDERVAA